MIFSYFKDSQTAISI